MLLVVLLYLGRRVINLVADGDVATVRQARKIPTIKIVSFDWLEDSLMTKRRRNERAYLMGPLATTAAEAKVRKKMTRRKNIAKSGMPLQRC